MASSNGQPDLLPYYPIVRDYLRRYAGRVASADDLAQSTYVQAYRALDGGSVPRNARAWLLSLARHVGCDLRRYDGRRPVVELDDAIESTLYDEQVHEPIHSIVREEDRARVRAAVDGLSREERQFVYAYYAPDRHLFDPATQFGIPAGLAKVRMYRLRKKLRRALE